MKIIIKSRLIAGILITLTSVSLLPITSFAKTAQVMTTDILQHLRKGEPWDRGMLTATKMVMFQQATSTTGGTDATNIVKITLSYFTSTDCSATNGTNVPTYTTPDGTSFTISVGTSFGMVAASVWNIGNSQVTPAIADMTTIQSVAATFRSTNNNTPQANFSGLSFACVPVTCSGGECTSGSGTQSFQLKTTAAIGDPADGGVIACMNTGNNLVTPATDNSTGIAWGGFGTTTGATSTTAGATNTATIVNCLSNSTSGGCPGNISSSTYAAGICSTYTANGGYTSGWFLPADNNTGTSGQLNCLFTNRVAIGGFTSTNYWSSTEFNALNARNQNFNVGTQLNSSKTTTTIRVRCVRTFTP